MAAHEVERDIYISCDLETDGPYPGRYSILSIGACVAGWSGTDGFVPAANVRSETFYCEVQPATDYWLPQALKATGIDRDRLAVTGLEPSDAAGKFCSWIQDVSKGFRPSLALYPTTFDWPFISHYLHQFGYEHPVTFTRVLDLRTLIVALSGQSVYTSTASCLPSGSTTHMRHEHNALEDAIDQAVLLAKVAEWRASVGAAILKDGSE